MLGKSQNCEFPRTRWTLVERAGNSGEEQHKALGELLEQYYPALRSYLCTVRRIDLEQADDLLQGFIADQILERSLIGRAAPSGGRFRSLLLVSLKNYANSRYRNDLRRKTGMLDEELSFELQSHPDVEIAWAKALINCVLERMHAECHRIRRLDVWHIFETRLLSQIFQDTPCRTYGALADECGLDSPHRAANLLVTAKRMYARILRSTISEYEGSCQDVEEEVRELKRVLDGS